ncbi:glutathione S-transferase theta-1-like [Rhineura floridana]|uniref:glutathione S-transferase theta-1-like n=1 Tax=Rhineura floridana TaxID=261503 RepID=UPI002AC819B7|nr:glutathione S-transferase theta-1-like [Rhineura floridana]
MVLQLYLDLVSQPCRSVYIFAKKNRIPFEFKHVVLIQGQNREEDFSKVNMMKKVPALKDGNFTLAESIAILLYLARKFKTPDHWYPADLQKRARVDEYLSWQHTATRMYGTKFYLAKGLVPLFLGHPLPPEKLEEATEELNEVLKMFEEKFLQDRPFIAGSEISLADLVAIVELMQPKGAGYDVFEGSPKMAAWRGRVEDAVGKDLFLEAHKEILNSKGMTADHLPPEGREQIKQHLLKYVK